MTDDEALELAVRRTKHERLRELVRRDPRYWSAVRRLAKPETAVPDAELAAPELPGPLTQAKNLLESVAAHAASGLAKVDDATYQARLETCESCPQLVLPAFRCGGCGCHLRAKARWASSTCPLRKWT